MNLQSSSQCSSRLYFAQTTAYIVRSFTGHLRSPRLVLNMYVGAIRGAPAIRPRWWATCRASGTLGFRRAWLSTSTLTCGRLPRTLDGKLLVEKNPAAGTTRLARYSEANSPAVLSRVKRLTVHTETASDGPFDAHAPRFDTVHFQHRCGCPGACELHGEHRGGCHRRGARRPAHRFGRQGLVG